MAAIPDPLLPARLSIVERLPYLVSWLLLTYEHQLTLEIECCGPRRFEVNNSVLFPCLVFQLTAQRLSYGALGRLQRSHPFEAMKFHDWEIPAGVSIRPLGEIRY